MRLVGAPARVLEMVRKEFLQIFRDPRLSRVIFIAPIIQLLAFGYAVSTDVRHTTTFVVDHDRTAVSRDLVEAFAASGYFDLVGGSDRTGDIVSALDHGRATMGIVIPPGFARDVAGPNGGTVQILLDGTNSNTATVVRGYAERIVQSYGARLAAPGDAAASAPANPSIELRERAWFNPDLASRDYNVPAVVGSLILLVCLLLTSLAVVREREIGTLEQLMVSPLRPAELIAGKTIPFALVGLADVALVTTVAILWFGIPFRGSLLLLFLATALYILSGLGIGLLISTASATQQEAFMATFLVFMPSILLSGFMFPVSSMPEPFQWITLLNPVRHFLVIVRGLFLKGIGLEALWPQYLALLGIGTSLLAFAATRFHKTVG
ncbi:MAG TPA: ABC transporter permease [Candidatus Eisenbacteria bacterium]|jgi:ABC-2 type transport system permease protein